MSTWKLLSAGALALALGWAPAQAAPASQAVAPAMKELGTDNGVSQIQYWRRGGRYRGRGVGLGLGLGLGVLGAAVIYDQAYRPRRGYYYDDYAYDGPYYMPSGYSGDPRTICAQNFRSFEWRTGLYTTYSGEKRLCPYLR
jgi:BA14K-like protein